VYWVQGACSQNTFLLCLTPRCPDSHLVLACRGCVLHQQIQGVQKCDVHSCDLGPAEVASPLWLLLPWYWTAHQSGPRSTCRSVCVDTMHVVRHIWGVKTGRVVAFHTNLVIVTHHIEPFGLNILVNVKLWVFF
jgi:hypothetical protein